MSKILEIKRLMSASTPRPWKSGARRPAGGRMIADVVTVPDSELLTEAVNAVDGLLALYAVAARLRTRLKAKKLNIIASDRDALYKALEELEK